MYIIIYLYLFRFVILSNKFFMVYFFLTIINMVGAVALWCSAHVVVLMWEI